MIVAIFTFHQGCWAFDWMQEASLGLFREDDVFL